MCRNVRSILVVGAIASLLGACGQLDGETSEDRGPLQIPRGLGKADSSFSCKGYCGKKAPGCYCDDTCATYGDCCPDKAQLCDSTPTPTPTICGGIAGLQCPTGYTCKLAGSYPDASGTCVPQNYCDSASDCAGLIHPMCLGAWECKSNSCHWKCGTLPTEKKCGPILNGQCDSGEVCNIKSCGLGALGTCVKQPQACIQLYEPVCGCNGTTYSNDCMRLAAGATFKHTGACQGGNTGTCTTDSDCKSGEFCGLKEGECLLKTFTILQGTCAPKPQACIQLYQPVCGCDGKTHGNACMAASKGINVASQGACQPVVTKDYCKGYCGKQAPGGCYCDSQCAKYGDCCPDVKTACGTN